MHRSILLLMAALLTLSLVACGEEATDDPAGAAGVGGDDTGTAGSGGTGGGGGDETIQWVACDPSPAQCATLEVPLDWERPDGQKLDVVVRRFKGSAAERGQIWMLQGGPGYPGGDLAYVANYFQQAGLDMDVYIPDYRGVGKSARLGCGSDNGGAGINRTCMNSLSDTYGDDGIRHFGTTDAAIDLHHEIQLFREAGKPVYVWGSSYGTFMGNRYLTLYPDEVDGAILDSMCHGSGCDPRQEKNYENLIKEVAGLCGADETCSSKLGSDPWARIVALYQSFDEGHCPFAGPHSKEYFTSMLISTMDDPTLMPFGLSMVYRAERCAPEDQDALNSLLQLLYGSTANTNLVTSSRTSGLTDDGTSVYLQMNIIFSEFWPADLTVEEAQQEAAARTVDMGSTVYDAGLRQYWAWPLYEVPAELRRWADTRTPVLLLNGSLDPRTPTEEILDVQDAFTAPHQHFYEMPYAGHGVLMTSAADPQLGVPCGFYLTVKFFEDPTADLDTSCIARVPGLNFRGDSRYTQHLFHTSDLWENDTATVALAPMPTPEEQYKIDRMKERAAELLH